MRPTLVFLKAIYANGRLVYRTGDECPPDLFLPDAVNRALDENWLGQCESNVRQSLYALFPRFSGCEQPLTAEQIARTPED